MRLVWNESGLSLQYLSSRNSWPMNSIGMPGAVSSIPVATRERLRAYHERGFEPSASAGMRGPRSVVLSIRTMS